LIVGGEFTSDVVGTPPDVKMMNGISDQGGWADNQIFRTLSAADVRASSAIIDAPAPSASISIRALASLATAVSISKADSVRASSAASSARLSGRRPKPPPPLPSNTGRK
jgi:hypothetical protein